jgi:Xaa-Pro aminopeptidase
VGSRAVLFTDGRYTAQARAEVRGVRVAIDKRSPAVRAVEWLMGQGVANCAFDAEQTTVAALAALRQIVPGKLRRKFLIATADLVAGLRQVKDDDEIARMRKAAVLGCRLFEGTLQ